MNQLSKHIIFLFLSYLIFISFFEFEVNAQNESFALEAEQNWDTYEVGGTCVSGTHNLFVADVDGDGVLEMVTGGFSYNFINGSRTANEAPFKIWSWNGQNVTLEASDKWIGNIGSLYAADLDGDNTVEIVTAGSFRNETGNSVSTLRIWHLNDDKLSMLAHYEGISVSSIFVSDADKDGSSEILTIGRLRKNSVSTSQLCLWRLQDNNLSLVERLELDIANVTSANSVYACDLENNGDIEIITGGYSDNLNNSKGQLCIWQWSGQEFSLKANETWQLVSEGYAQTIAGGTQGNTMVNNVKAGDLDGDGVKEIVTGGFAYDGEKVNAQLKIWRWDGNVLAQLESEEWATDYLTEAKSVSLNDVDGDGRMDIVTCGITAAEDSFKNAESIHDRGQLRVWGWDGSTLSLKQSADWSFDDGACAWNVAVGDLDKDGVLEIITVGCTALGNLCDPDMRIWSTTQVSTFPYNAAYAIAGIGAVAALSTVILFRHMKRNKIIP